MTTTQKITCTQTACNAPRGGDCLEGDPTRSCKFASVVDVTSDDEAFVKQEQRSSLVPAFTHVNGEKLVVSGANRVLRQMPTRFVVIAGQPESGKTTLVAQLFEFINKGPFAGYAYAWSDTLPAYERLCFSSRTVSERTMPTTDRTTLSEPEFLHLRVRDVDNTKPAINILLSDIQGEVFSNSLQTSTEIKKLTYFERADHVALLIDGEKLASSRERHKESTDARTLLRSLVDNGMLQHRPYVQILFSRWDLACASDDAAGAEAAAYTIEQQFSEHFGKNFSELKFLRIAARPSSGSLEIGYNVDNLFSKWIVNSPLNNQSNTSQVHSTSFSDWINE